MRSDTALARITWGILEKVYNASDPPLDFKNFKKEVESGALKCPKEWFLQHTITQKKYNAIIARARKNHSVTKREFDRISWLLFNYAPKFED